MAKKSGGGIFKRLLGNKNTVTLIGVVACVATLVIGYNMRVNSQTSNIIVPYAKETIKAKTVITADMVGRIRVPSQYSSDAGGSFITSQKEVVTNYATYKSDIPAGSLFYKNMVKTKEELPDAAFRDIPDGYTLYSLSVDAESTFGNAIRAGDYIDLYLSTVDTEQSDEAQAVFGKLYSSIRVEAVKDSKGNNITRNSLDNGTPAEMLFSVPDEIFILLKEAEYIGGFTITPVRYNEEYSISAADLKQYDELVAYIIAHRGSI